MAKTDQEYLLYEFTEHPGFKLFYEWYLKERIQRYENQLLSDGNADTDKVMYSENYINKKMRWLLMELVEYPQTMKKIYDINNTNLASSQKEE